MITITYHDVADLQYGSFYLEGLMQEQRRYGYRLRITHATPPDLSDVMSADEWRAFVDSVSLFSVVDGRDAYLFCVDNRDSAVVDSGRGYVLPLLDIVRYYFKVNYNRTVVEADPRLARHAAKIVPVPPSFSLRPHARRSLLPLRRPDPRNGWTWQKSRRRLRQLRQLPTLDWLRTLRDHPRDLDVFFVVAYYAQDHHAVTNRHRVDLVRRLREHPHINAFTGVVSSVPLPAELAALQVPPLSYGEYLTNLARARLAIYVRGAHDCLSFKLPEYLALGKPIIGERLANNVEMLYACPHFCTQFAHDEPAGLVDTAAAWLATPARLDELSAANARTFDEELSPVHGARRILRALGLAEVQPELQYA